ncbi:MAG: hypothetical protein ACE5E1_01030 [Phycisphaerae bacterium]
MAAWLTLIVLMAWAVHSLWTSIVKPKAVNAVLLPGTLVAQLGRIVGLLITGAKVNNTALMENDEKGEPATDPYYEPRIPVIGPVLVGLLPMLATGGAMVILLTRLGMPVVRAAPRDAVSMELPRTAAAFWDQLRAVITQAEGTLDALTHADMAAWQLGVFVYLMICLTVRMAPFTGNVRGHLGAALTTAGVLALAATVSPWPTEWIKGTWPLISLAVGWLVLLLMISLLARGAVSVAQTILHWE